MFEELRPQVMISMFKSKKAEAALGANEFLTHITDT